MWFPAPVLPVSRDVPPSRATGSEPTPERVAADPPEGWPEPDRPADERIDVVLVGTYHMDEPGEDEVNPDVPDPLATDQQAQIRELADRLVLLEPDGVAVERPYDRADRVNAVYERYRDGRSYDAEAAIEPPDPGRDEPFTECRSEVVQVGFRLADRLGHDLVHAVDEFPPKPEQDPFDEREIDSARKTPAPDFDPAEHERAESERLREETVRESFRRINGEPALAGNHRIMFDRGLRAADERFGSPAALTYWYDRNVRIAHHLWRAADEAGDRLLFVVGSGHVRALRHLLTESPVLHPVSPLPVL
jgi:hypothetical protein